VMGDINQYSTSTEGSVTRDCRFERNNSVQCDGILCTMGTSAISALDDVLRREGFGEAGGRIVQYRIQ
jgi:hypothetical protein